MSDPLSQPPARRAAPPGRPARTATDPWGSPTQWSVVLEAAHGRDHHHLRASWRRLIERYRAPVRAAIARRSARGDDPEALADEFFSYLFEHGLLARVSPERGRFRAFAQAVLERFLLRRRRDRGRAERLAVEPTAPRRAPGCETQDEQVWAMQILRLGLQRVFAHAPRDATILVLYYGIAWPAVPRSGAPHSRQAIAAGLAMSVAAVDQANHRARRFLRRAIEAELGCCSPAGGADAAERACRLLDSRPGVA